jgi:hypothetical protein
MCLELRKNWKKPYYTKTKYRWKILENNCGYLISHYHYMNWKIGEWYKVAQVYGTINIRKDKCFHVFPERINAKGKAIKIACIIDWSILIVKLEVKGFVASGTWDDIYKSETWKSAKIVKVEDMHGNDITESFK